MSQAQFLGLVSSLFILWRWSRPSQDFKDIPAAADAQIYTLAQVSTQTSAPVPVDVATSFPHLCSGSGPMYWLLRDPVAQTRSLGVASVSSVSYFPTSALVDSVGSSLEIWPEPIHVSPAPTHTPVQAAISSHWVDRSSLSAGLSGPTLVPL